METRENGSNAWAWISIGVGAGLLATLIAGLGYHYWESQNRKRDPRAEKVRELLDEVEKLQKLARKSTVQGLKQRQQA